MSAAEEPSIDDLMKLATLKGPNNAFHRMLAKAKLVEMGLMEASEAFPRAKESAKLPKSNGGQGRSLSVVGGKAAKAVRSKAHLVRVSDIEPEELDWLFPEVVPLGTVTLIAGDPGASKSTIARSMATAVSLGAPWGGMAGADRKPGSVVILTAEENLGNHVRPRLEAAGADLERIHVLKTIELPCGRLAQFSLTRDIEPLDEAVKKIGDVRLIVIDPVGHYTGSADEAKTSDVREAMGPLIKLAENNRLAVVLIAHLNKGQGTSVLYRVSGNISFAAVSRMVWFVSRHPGDKSKRVMTFVKGNVGDGTDPQGFAMSMHNGVLCVDADRVEWNADEVNKLLVDQLAKHVRIGTRGPAPTGVERAKEIIGALIAKAPCMQSAAVDSGMAQGLSESTVKKALKELLKLGKVERFRSPENKRWWLQKMPELPLADPADEPASDCAPGEQDQAE